jgi:hypothetical protein
VHELGLVGADGRARPSPVFALARGADDPAGLWSLAFVIERSLGTR